MRCEKACRKNPIADKAIEMASNSEDTVTFACFFLSLQTPKHSPSIDPLHFITLSTAAAILPFLLQKYANIHPTALLPMQF